jgi:signal transduction histidine kinase
MNYSPPPPETVILGQDGRFAQTVEPAARAAFPASRIVSEGSAAKALSQERPQQSSQMILLSSKEEADALYGVFAVEPGASPAVTALPWVSTLPGGNCEEAIARVIQSEWEAHALRVENQKLAGDLAMIGRRVGHDIRAQLGGIVSTADLMADLFPDPDDPHFLMTKTIHRSVEEILILLDRVKAIVMTASPAPRDQEMMIGDVAMAEARRLEEKLKERDATLDLPGDWPPVHGVHPWLKVIWSSLLTNAVQHGGDGVHIETGWSENGDWRFWVRDNGPGVDENRRKTLFPSIHALHELHGHGSGLAIVRRLCEQMNGNCGYEAPKDGGSCFWFTLPASAAMNTAIL